MFKRLLTLLRNRSRREPYATVLSMEDRSAKRNRGKIVKVARPKPEEAQKVEILTMSRQEYLNEHGDMIDMARHQANRKWIVAHAPDECLFR